MTREELTKGIFKHNPIFYLVLGLCPTLAVSTRVDNALGMSVGVLFVLVCSNTTLSLLRHWIPSQVRIPSFIVVIASFVTVVELLMQGYAPDLYARLGIYVPLIVVNCIILGRVEAFASKKPVFDSLLDAIGMGLGFGVAIVSIALCRELLGVGGMTLLGYTIIPTVTHSPVLAMILAPGAFLTVGVILALSNYKRLRKRRE
jgi:electron transport complex protein RnfE